MFDNTDDQQDIQEETDFLGGSRFFETGIYDFVIDMAYYDKSKGGAGSLNLTLKTKDGRELKQTLWVKSGDKKGNKNFYIDGKQQKRYLPGYIVADGIALLGAKKSIIKIAAETKTISVYDYEAKKELPVQKDVLVELLGVEITLGVKLNIVDKNEDDGNGNYIATGVTRRENEIDKVFRTADSMTVPEVRAKAEVPVFKDKWAEKNTGEIFDRTVAQKGERTEADVDGGTSSSSSSDDGDGDDMFSS